MEVEALENLFSVLKHNLIICSVWFYVMLDGYELLIFGLTRPTIGTQW